MCEYLVNMVGVCPIVFFTFISAPCAISNLTISLLPSLAAINKAVSPFLFT